MTPLQHSLLEWYRTHHRALPWRMERDPYRILLSEVLLQQTRVDQAIPYYHRFLERFPDLCSLGKAELEEVLRVWQGAGYYARARNLHKLAQVISAGTAPEPLLPSDPSLIHISEPPRRTPIPYAGFCVEKKKTTYCILSRP
ncbi:hypothetical protein GN073_09310, partial [Helicobacter pylori]|nr:hypothetical protein [Helicobacter pylori]